MASNKQELPSVYLLQVLGRVPKKAELKSAVWRQVLGYFKRSRANRYTGYYEILFGDAAEQPRWELKDNHHVIIDTICRTNPELPDTPDWAVRFRGTWDIAAGKFVHRDITVIRGQPSDPTKTLLDAP